jgi:hypothetical protein
MKRAEAILAACMAMFLAGCLLRGNPKPAAQAVPVAPRPEVAAAPAPPSQPLSITQTQIELPPAQPVNPDALAGIEAPSEEPAPAPAAPKPPKGRVSQPARTEPPAQPAAQPTTPEPAAERPPIVELMTEEERRELQAASSRDRQEASRLVEHAGTRLNHQQQHMKQVTESYLKLSQDAEKQGDFRQARDLAAKALVLAKELQP